jgi:hypothetical protein
VSAKQQRRRSVAKRCRIHFRELGCYQCIVDAASVREAIDLVRRSPPDLPAFIAAEERDVFGIDELRANRTWKPLPNKLFDDGPR